MHGRMALERTGKMIISKVDNIKITGICTSFPTTRIPVEYYNDLLGKDAINKFKRTTGIHSRYISKQEQTASDLAYVAAKHLLKAKNTSPREIQAIVFVTQCPDYVKPATAYVLQSRLGCPQDSIIMDINQGCSGFIYGVYTLSNLMAGSNISKGLLLLGDVEGKERLLGCQKGIVLNTLLFGDSGAAILFEKTEEPSQIVSALRNDGGRFHYICDSFGWRHPDQKYHETFMDGVAVFSFAINEVPNLIEEFLNIRKETSEDYDCLALHQSNLAIMKQIIRRSHFPKEKVPVSIDEYANTSMVSVINAIVKHYGAETDGTAKILACCYGVGLSWGVLSFQIDKSFVLPPVYTDDFFLDGIM